MSLWALLCAMVGNHVGRGRAVPKLFPQVGSMKFSKISFHWNYGAKLCKPEKQPHTIIPLPLNFTVGMIQSDKYRSPGNRQTHTLLLDCQTEKCDLSLQRTCQLLWSPVAACFTPLHLTLCITLDDVGMLLLSHGNPFLEAV